LKKTLLEKIKKHQQHEKITSDELSRDNSSDSIKNDKQFHDNFMNSLDYLNKLNEKNNTSKHNRAKRNKYLKNGAVANGNNNKIAPLVQGPSEPIVSIDLPMDFDSPHTNPHTNSQTYINSNGNGITGENIIHTSSMNENLMYGGSNISVPYQTTPIHVQSRPISQVQSRPISKMLPRPISQVQSRPISQIQPRPISQVQSRPISQVQSRPITPDAPYGCLKGGKKPTYRTYHNKTLKNNPLIINTSNRHDNTTIVNAERKQKLVDLKKSYKKIRQKKRVTRKSTFNLGKIGGKVSVLIKNNATRRKVKREHGLLKQKSITEIKKHLYDKNLLKIGSTAPNDVLRTLYEQSILAGDVTNTSNEVQIHNFMNK
jgi:hypothetical protein